MQKYLAEREKKESKRKKPNNDIQETQTSTEEISHLSNLEDETKMAIFSFLNASNLIRVSVTSSDMYRVATDELLWRPLVISFFGSASGKRSEENYRKYFYRVFEEKYGFLAVNENLALSQQQLITKLIFAVQNDDLRVVKHILAQNPWLLKSDIKIVGGFSLYDLLMYFAMQNNNKQIISQLLLAKLTIDPIVQSDEHIDITPVLEFIIPEIKSTLSEYSCKNVQNLSETFSMLFEKFKDWRTEPGDICVGEYLRKYFQIDLLLWLVQEKIIDVDQVLDKEIETKEEGKKWLDRVIALDSLTGLQFLLQQKIIKPTSKLLIRAVSTNSVARLFDQSQIIKFLIENCELDLHANNWCGESITHIAARQGHYQLVKYLIEEKNTSIDEDVLLQAISSGNFQLVRYIYDKMEPKINFKLNANGVKALLNVFRGGYVDIAEWLILDQSVDTAVLEPRNFSPQLLDNPSNRLQLNFDSENPQDKRKAEKKLKQNRQKIMDLAENKSLLEFIKNLSHALVKEADDISKENLETNLEIVDRLNSKARMLGQFWHWINNKVRESLTDIINEMLLNNEGREILYYISEDINKVKTKQENGWLPNWFKKAEHDSKPTESSTIRDKIIDCLKKDTSIEGLQALNGYEQLLKDFASQSTKEHKIVAS